MHSLVRPDSPTSGPVRELVSGIDALYLSGRADVAPAVFELLDDRRAHAEALEVRPVVELAGEEFAVAPRSFGKYRYRLEHPAGLVGLTPSERLPRFRVQPRAEFLHGVGITETLRFFERVCEYLAGGPVDWSVSRLDLFCDLQGWNLTGEDRRNFVCRATRRDLHEEQDGFTGLEFGRRSTKTICARIYDKTLQVETKGLDWWRDVWGPAWDQSQPVLRVEFEFGRQALVEFGAGTPEAAFAAASGMWASASTEWLSYRLPTSDGTRSRWPVAPEWSAVQGATLRGEAAGLERVRSGRRRGELRRIMPALVGYLARVGALSGTHDVGDTLGALRYLIGQDERRRGIAFADRIGWARDEERYR